MSVQDLILRLARCEQTAEVLVNDDDFGEIEEIDTDDGPAVIFWSARLDD